LSHRCSSDNRGSSECWSETPSKNKVDSVLQSFTASILDWNVRLLDAYLQHTPHRKTALCGTQLIEQAPSKLVGGVLIPGRVMPKNSKTVFAVCLATSLMGGNSKVRVHGQAQCCHWLATSAAHTAKAAA